MSNDIIWNRSTFWLSHQLFYFPIFDLITLLRILLLYFFLFSSTLSLNFFLVERFRWYLIMVLSVKWLICFEIKKKTQTSCKWWVISGIHIRMLWKNYCLELKFLFDSTLKCQKKKFFDINDTELKKKLIFRRFPQKHGRKSQSLDISHTEFKTPTYFVSSK